MAQRFNSSSPGQASVPGQPRYQPASSLSAGMRPYGQGSNFSQRNFAVHQNPSPVGNTTPVGTSIHQRTSQPNFQSGLRGSGSGTSSKRSQEVRSIGQALSKGDCISVKKKKKTC